MEGASIYFLLLLLATLVFTSHASLNTDQKTNLEFLKTSCNSTTFPRLCFTSLSIHASTIQTSPKLLAHIALSVTLNATKLTSTAMKKLSKRIGLIPREIAAMSDCVEELSDSVDELRRSIGEMKNLKERSWQFELMISNIQTWVSAALTDESTCTDGFEIEAMNGKMKNEVRVRIVNVAQLTSIALALVNNYASHHG
ncbi:hypothetical protein LguiA_023959 [Lonicera macranthoides]